MKQFATVVLASVAGFSTNADARFRLSDYWGDGFDEAVPSCWYDNPVNCKYDGNCASG